MAPVDEREVPGSAVRCRVDGEEHRCDICEVVHLVLLDLCDRVAGVNQTTGGSGEPQGSALIECCGSTETEKWVPLRYGDSGAICGRAGKLFRATAQTAKGPA